MFNWSDIDTVLLDMDGTLLDLHFDNHFWLEHVPLRYAETHSISYAEAKQVLSELYKNVEGTLDWYCVDHWSRELGLDILLLKQEVDHLIAVHPHVLEFLEALAAAGKRRVLVTNAHQKSLNLKLEKTQLHGHLDGVVCSHDMGVPKEDTVFWWRLQEIEPFDADRTLFVDDSLPVLRSAHRYGIKNLLAIMSPDTRQPKREVTEFPAVADFSELLPALSAYANSMS